MIQVALFRFQSFYLRNRVCFLLLRVLSHFNSPRVHAPLFMARNSVTRGSKADMRLPSAYRSLPRPSSLLEPSHPLGGFKILCSSLDFSSNQLHQRNLT